MAAKKKINQEPQLPSFHIARIIVIVVIVAMGIILVIWRGSFKEQELKNDSFVNINDSSLEIRLLTGAILEIKENSLVVDIPSILGVEIPDNSPLRKREIVVDAETLILLSQEKSDAQYGEELANYQKKRADGEPALPPSPKNELSITFQELDVGDYIQITGKDTGDIKNQSIINALKIIKK